MHAPYRIQNGIVVNLGKEKNGVGFYIERSGV